MSRCFPFPPPGYEKKPRPEDEDLIKEEKRKEKKHKKEKKDKEKKEGKEKRDKDRSDGQHREKKDKKDKHRDKKEKHKDKKVKDKDKETSSISEEARVTVLPGASSGQQIPRGDEHVRRESINSQEPNGRDHSHGQHGEKLFKTSLPAVETESSKFVQELARRIRDEQQGAGSQLAEGIPVKSKRDEKTNSVFIKDSGNLAEDKQKHKEKKVYSNKMDGQAVRFEPRIGANAILSSFAEMEKSKSHGMPRPLEENVENRGEEKEKSKEKRDDKPRDKKKDKEKDSRSHGKGKDREKEKKREEKAKDKSAHRKSDQDKSRQINKGDFVGVSDTKLQVPLVPKDNSSGIVVTEGHPSKRKEIETNGFLHSRDIKKSDFVGGSNTKHQVSLVPEDNIAGIVTEGNHRKRKDIETNGFLHESELRPAKLLRPSSSHSPTQNGKRLETHQNADMLSSNKQGGASDIQMVNKQRSVNGTIKLSNKQVATDIQVENKDQGVNGTIKLSKKHGGATNIEVENKEHGVNGTINGLAVSKPKPLAMSKPKDSSISPGADQIAEASKRPHPDSKYLDQILAVPKMGEWYGFDDQEWLFGSKSAMVRKPDTYLDEVKDNRVWSEALQIDSADVCALPYVIPY